jgi:Protein of unknown function (DUF3309)
MQPLPIFGYCVTLPNSDGSWRTLIAKHGPEALPAATRIRSVRTCREQAGPPRGTRCMTLERSVLVRQGGSNSARDPENPQPLSISWHPSLDEENRVIEGNRMRLVLLVVLIVLLLGALPTWPYSAGWGYYPSGGLGLVLLIVLVLALMGRL